MMFRAFLALWLTIALAACSAATNKTEPIRPPAPLAATETTAAAPSAAAPTAATPTAATATNAGEKRIAISFDDIPRQGGAFFTPEQRSQKLIATLRDVGVTQAAFFVNPGNLGKPDRAGGEERIAAYVAAGHVIANHSYSHPHLRKTEASAYLADIDRAEEWLKGRAGYRPWFRHPFLDEGGRDKAKRDAVRAGLAERGLRNGYVTVEASDWFYEQAVMDAKAEGQAIDTDALRDLYVDMHVGSAEFGHDLAQRTLGRAPAQVMLLHENDLAALYIGDLVEALKAKGWTIISADDAFADPISQLHPDVPSAQGTLIEALAWERDMPAPRWFEPNNTEIAAAFFRTRVLGLPANIAAEVTPEETPEETPKVTPKVTEEVTP